MGDLVLEIVEGPRAGHQLPLTGTIVIGRSQERALGLEDTQISREHASIEPAGEAATLTDLGSTNGTFVNDQQIHSPRMVGAGDRIRTGLTLFELRDGRQTAGQGPQVVPKPPIAPVASDVLRPVDSDSLPGAQASLAPFRVRFEKAEDDPAYAALTALVDARVKQQTSVAALAFLSLSALLVLVFFGVR